MQWYSPTKSPLFSSVLAIVADFHHAAAAGDAAVVRLLADLYFENTPALLAGKSRVQPGTRIVAGGALHGC